ncbi:MAG: hypothetical protein K1Y36_23100 [Blastocatellia bacterium]|nr:hypothetical protein [Blastocatellia bacterium]
MAAFFSDLQSKRLIALKGILFLGLGFLCLGLLLSEGLSFRQWCLVVIALWAFCRFYYFLFYVIEKYLDPTFKFSGLRSVITYLMALPGRKAGRLNSPISNSEEEKQ